MKHIGKGLCVLLSCAGLLSCEDFLDREPLTDITPENYFTTADQVAAYTVNYYVDHLRDSRGNYLAHQTGQYNSGKTRNDDVTDNLLVSSGSLEYFAGNKLVPAGKNLQTLYERVRVWNWLLEEVEPKMESGELVGAEQYVGEAYFFRALAYYNGLVQFGDLPIVDEVLPDDNAVLVENSRRAPRNQVARFILTDLDTACSLLQSKSDVGTQRINKETALLLKSRVALFEGTFEKYHRETGRVPGDAGWPGEAFTDTTFNIDSEINFFLEEAIASAAEVADAVTLAANSHQMNPDYGVIAGWNPYFEMFSDVSLDGYDEVLLWREYSSSANQAHSAAYQLGVGGDQLGLSHSYVRSFLMQDGLPYYASSLYEGDASVSQEKANRDERLQLFVAGEEDVLASDPTDPDVYGDANGHEPYTLSTLDTLNITNSEIQTLDKTGYRPRKYLTYDYSQRTTQVASTTACPIFRGAEALLNYIEAYYVRYGTLDEKARSYWQQLRSRAGVSTDIDATIASTDLTKEFDNDNGIVKGDLAVYSGTEQVDATLYNIRRERRCEFISEGMRWDDLKRWRSWDMVLESGANRYLFQGMNIWDEAYKKYGIDKDYPLSGYEAYERNAGNNMDPDYPYLWGSNKVPFRVDPLGDGGNVSAPDDALTGKYLSPLRLNTQGNQQLANGYSWHKAYYLEPLGVQDLTLTATDATDTSTSMMYQNPFWPTSSGYADE